MYLHLNTKVVIVYITFFCMGKGGNAQTVFEPGMSDFSKVVEFKAFVDKSFLINDLFTFRHVHITAPRRFGKSTNLDMVRRFIAVQLDATGKPLDVKLNSNYGLFKENNLKICEDDEFFNKYFGKFPVLDIDFSGFKQVRDLNDVLLKFRTIVKDAFVKHKYLLQNATLFGKKVKDKDLFTKYLNGEAELFTANDFSASLTFLCKYLTKNFRKRVFVLVDDYDCHVQSLLYSDSQDIQKILVFVHSIFEKVVFKDELNIYGALLTGLLRVSGSTSSDYHHYTFLYDNDYCTYYGFTEDEVNTLLTKLVQSDEKRTTIKSKIDEFYKGYAIIDLNKKPTMYSTWSILKYLDNLKNSQEPEAYFCEECCSQILNNFFNLKGFSDLLNTLLSKEYVRIKVDEFITKEKIVSINKAIRNREATIDPSLIQLTKNLLYNFGLLSANENCTAKLGEVDVRMVNKEVLISLQKFLDAHKVK